MQEGEHVEYFLQRLSFRDTDRRTADLTLEFLVAGLLFAVRGLCDIWTVKHIKCICFYNCHWLRSTVMGVVVHEAC